MSSNEGAATVRGDSEMHGASVVIVGGGVTGLSTAFWLAKAGVDVLVLERGTIGWEASGRNGGGCTHPQSPLFEEEQRLWPMMDEILGYPTEFQAHRIRMAMTPELVELYRRSVRNAQRPGYEVDELDARQIREMIPLAGDTVAGAFHYRFGGHANPHRTVQAYAWAMQDLGSRLRQHVTVAGFTTSGDRVTGVETDHGLFGCDQVMIAAGPQTARLAGLLGIAIPMRPARAEMIVTEPLPLMPIGGTDGTGLYGRQTLRGNLAYGGGPHEWVEMEETPTQHRPSTPLAGNIAMRVAQLFPKAAHAKVIRSWSGIIENTPDGRPILDQPEPWTNLTVATMSGVGFGLSPATGRALSQLITQRRCDFADLSSLKLERFADLEPDWDALQGWLPHHVAAL